MEKTGYSAGTTEKDTVLHGSKWEMVGQGRDHYAIYVIMQKNVYSQTGHAHVL
jgi:hypothetical protein